MNELKEEVVEVAENSNMVLNFSKKNILYYPFNFLLKEYDGNHQIFINTINNIINFGLSSGIIKNKNHKKILKILKYGLSAGIFTMDFAAKLKHYLNELKKENNSQIIKHKYRISEIFNKTNINGLSNWTEIINVGVLKWLLDNPQTKSIKIIDYFDFTHPTTEKIENVLHQVKINESKFILILFEYKDKRFILENAIFKNNKGEININESTLWYYGDIIPYKIFGDILVDYINNLKTSENVIYFDFNNDIAITKRNVLSEDLNQYNINAFLNEIRYILNNKKKRTYAFVGKQGVGKSSVLKAVEQHLTEFIIFKYNKNTISNWESRINLVNQLQPIIILMEDIDSWKIQNKYSEVTKSLLEFMDYINNKNLNVVLIYTANDTSLIHPTIINRPGRTDRVEEILPPQTEDEVIEVIINRLNIIKRKYKEIKFPREYNKKCYFENASKCIKHGFTQAEIADAIIEQSLIEYGLNKNKVFNSENFQCYLNNAIQIHLNTTNAIKTCNFEGKDPNKYEINNDN